MKITPKERIYAKTLLAMDESANAYNSLCAELPEHLIEKLDAALEKYANFKMLDFKLKNSGSILGQN